MDSLTQIVLGAACGEVVLGKKAGNRAMLWGGIGGTIPDLDIVAYFFTDNMTALAMHRGFSHSLVFAFTAPLLFGWLVARFYKSGLYQQKLYKGIAMGTWLLLLSAIAFGVNYIPISMDKGVSLTTLSISVGAIILITILLWRKYFTSELEEVEISWKEWAWLFFWAILTHPLLDCCTSYGTQLFQPFSDYRVALNNISVADPIYTIPFMICLIIAGYLTRTSSKRRWFNWAGIGISSLYLVFTFYQKIKVDTIFENSLQAQNISYQRFTTGPTIFNNVLWHGVAETEDAFYHGMYSVLDKEPRVSQFFRVEKNHHLIEGHYQDYSIQTLTWFSNNYYSISKTEDGHLQLNDMRFGSRTGKYGSNDDYIFKFILKEENGILKAEENREPPKNGQMAELFKRMKGI